jgi:hypothetical protein
MMGPQDRDQRQLFYEFSLDEVVPKDHLLRRITIPVPSRPSETSPAPCSCQGVCARTKPQAMRGV